MYNQMPYNYSPMPMPFTGDTLGNNNPCYEMIINLEKRINILESKVKKLEGNNQNNYSTNNTWSKDNMYML